MTKVGSDATHNSDGDSSSHQNEERSAAQPVTPEGTRSIASRLSYIEELLVYAQEAEREHALKSIARAVDEVRRLREDWSEPVLSRRTRNLSLVARRRAARFVVGGLRRLPARREKSFRVVVDEEWETESECEKAATSLSSSRRVIHPNSAFKRRWDFASSVLALAFVFGAEARAAAQRSGAPLIFIQCWASLAPWSAVACHLFFAIDMILNFVTGYVDASGALIMSKRRIAKNYVVTGAFLLDIWCLVGFSETPAKLQAPRLCARGSIDTALSYCDPPKRRRFLAPFRVIVAVYRRVPPALAFAKRTGRLRTVIVHSPGITAAVVHFRGLLRATKLIKVKWTSLLVFLRGLARFFAKQAQIQIDNAYEPVRKRLDARRKSKNDIKNNNNTTLTNTCVKSVSAVPHGRKSTAHPLQTEPSSATHDTNTRLRRQQHRSLSSTNTRKLSSANASLAAPGSLRIRHASSDYVLQVPSIKDCGSAVYTSTGSRHRTASLDSLTCRPDTQEDPTARTTFQRVKRPVIGRRLRRSRSKPDLTAQIAQEHAPIVPLTLEKSDSLRTEYSAEASEYCGDDEEG